MEGGALPEIPCRSVERGHSDTQRTYLSTESGAVDENPRDDKLVARPADPFARDIAVPCAFRPSADDVKGDVLARMCKHARGVDVVEEDLAHLASCEVALRAPLMACMMI